MGLKRTILLGGALASLAATATSAQDITIGIPNWAAAEAIAYMVETLVEQETGLEVNGVASTNPVIFEAMDKGDIHIHPDVWLPNQSNLTDRFVNEVGTVRLAQNSYDGFAGFCVTRATAESLGITSVYDLTDPDIARQFDTDGNGKGEIWVGASGWAGTSVDTVRLTSYGVAETFDLLELDETIAISRMKEASASGIPFATLCFAPHMMFQLADLVQLDEPAYDESKWTMVQPTDDPNWLEKSSIEVAYPPITLRIAYATALEDISPRAVEILNGIQLDTETVNAWNYQIVEEKMPVKDVVDAWMAENTDRVDGWLGF